MAFRYGFAKAVDVRAKAVAKLGEREREFLISMLSYTDVAGTDEADLETLRDAYRERSDEIWLSDGSLESDNERHSADDYYQGYEAGAAMVLTFLCEAFEITPETGPDVNREEMRSHV